jgi:biotin carboxyl carrier protein
VVAVSAQVGDRVQAGDEVCVIESMKMEQSIRCDQAGVVKAVFVRPGQTVQAGDALVEVEGEGG